MRAAAAWGLAIGGLGCCGLLAGCGTETGDGPTKHLCSTVVGDPGGGPTWYVDGPRHSGDTVTLHLGSTASTWLRVSDDCAHGAAVTASTTGIVHDGPRVTAIDGRPEAVNVTPIEAGRETLRFGSSSVTFVVTPLP